MKVGNSMSAIIEWFRSNPVASFWVKTFFYLVIVLIGVVVARRFFKKILNTEGRDAKQKTIFPIINDVVNALIYFFAFCIVLEIFGVSTTPIWTVASAVSVAIGFGAQQVVKDIFSGFLIILEDQYSVGDIIEINGKMGEVEQVLLRTTIIRDGVDGSVHIVSNGEIRVVTNLSKNYMIAVVDLPVSYEQDIDPLLDTIKGLAKQYPHNQSLFERVNVLGVREFADRSLSIRITCKTRVGENWAVERDLRRYFKHELNKLGIELPFAPIYVKQDE